MPNNGVTLRWEEFCARLYHGGAVDPAKVADWLARDENVAEWPSIAIESMKIVWRLIGNEPPMPTSKAGRVAAIRTRMNELPRGVAERPLQRRRVVDAAHVP
jgi:hypothetical protein